MRIGVPKEIKAQEYRVGLTPASVRELTHHGHAVLVQTGAGRGIGIDDADLSKGRRQNRYKCRRGISKGAS